MRICVISDVHFKYIHDKPHDRENNAIALRFLSECVGKYDLMVLNGDIFDLWFDWKYTIIAQYFPILHRLANIRDAGCKLVLISGNHDFWFNSFLSTHLGMRIEDRQYKLQTDGKTMVFAHGDLYTENDTRYKIFRALVRIPVVKSLFSLLHPDLALSIGAMLSRSSRVRNVCSQVKTRMDSGLRKWAERQINSGCADIVVLGHNHEPCREDISGGVYANCGDWVKNHSYVEIDAGNVTLNMYDK
jgi:UDP-2,3-diacylglucosamine hydrolase